MQSKMEVDPMTDHSLQENQFTVSNCRGTVHLLVIAKSTTVLSFWLSLKSNHGTWSELSDKLT